MTHFKNTKGATLAGLLATVAFLSLPADSQAGAKDNWKAITQCAAIADDSARLICMDAVMRSAGVDVAEKSASTASNMASPKAAQAPAPAPAAPAVAATPPAPAVPAAPAPSSQTANLSPSQRESFFPKEEPKDDRDEVKDIEVTLASVTRTNSRKYILTDGDGVVWRQLYTRSSMIPPEPGQAMTVHKNSLGGYMCRVENTPSFRCKPGS